MIIKNYRVEVPQYERVPRSDGLGFSTRPAPSRFIEVELTIDDAMIASYLGVRAASSKRGKSTYLDGMVSARIIANATGQTKRSESSSKETTQKNDVLGGS